MSRMEDVATSERVRTRVTSADIQEAMQSVACAELVLETVKRRVGELIRTAYLERNLSLNSDIDPSLLSKIIRGQSFSAPGIQQVIKNLQQRDNGER